MKNKKLGGLGIAGIALIGIGIWGLTRKAKPTAKKAKPTDELTTGAATIVSDAHTAATQLLTLKPAAIKVAVLSPAVVSGEVLLAEATQAIASIQSQAAAAVVAQALELVPSYSEFKATNPTRGQDFAYRYGVDEATGNLMATMTPGQLLAYNIAHGI